MQPFQQLHLAELQPLTNPTNIPIQNKQYPNNPIQGLPRSKNSTPLSFHPISLHQFKSLLTKPALKPLQIKPTYAATMTDKHPLIMPIPITTLPFSPTKQCSDNGSNPVPHSPHRPDTPLKSSLALEETCNSVTAEHNKIQNRLEDILINIQTISNNFQSLITNLMLSITPPLSPNQPTCIQHQIHNESQDTRNTTSLPFTIHIFDISVTHMLHLTTFENRPSIFHWPCNELRLLPQSSTAQHASFTAP